MRKRFLQKHLAVDTSFFINYIKKGTRITVRKHLQENYFGWIKALSPSIPEEYKSSEKEYLPIELRNLIVHRNFNFLHHFLDIIFFELRDHWEDSSIPKISAHKTLKNFPCLTTPQRKRMNSRFKNFFSEEMQKLNNNFVSSVERLIYLQGEIFATIPSKNPEANGLEEININTLNNWFESLSKTSSSQDENSHPITPYFSGKRYILEINKILRKYGGEYVRNNFPQLTCYIYFLMLNRLLTKPLGSTKQFQINFNGTKIEIEKNTLNDLKISICAFPYIDRFLTFDKGQALLMRNLFPDSADKIKYFKIENSEMVEY